MHRTLKAETAKPPAATHAAQQRRFDRFRTEFNQERPHEALGQTPPAEHYSASSRSYPTRLEDPNYPDHYELRRVRNRGEIKWQGQLVYISEALSSEIIGLCENEKGDAQVHFGPIGLGVIDAITRKLKREIR